jgi:hypothetical protein
MKSKHGQGRRIVTRPTQSCAVSIWFDFVRHEMIRQKRDKFIQIYNEPWLKKKKKLKQQDETVSTNCMA